MARLTSEPRFGQIGTLFDGGSVTGSSDRQLLERFVAGRDDSSEAAFTALVARHGPMVLSVCRQVVGDAHHAEDAFQAVFLVLARRAPSIRDPDLLGNWLYGVALRTSRKARGRLAQRGRLEVVEAGSRPDRTPSRTGPTSPPADEPAMAREQLALIHDEIEQLPRAFRLAVVLCDLEGLPLHEAARRLRCPAGTIGSRLARARDKLRRGLTRRGVVLPAAALAASLKPQPAAAHVSSLPCDFTAKAASRFAAGSAAKTAAANLAQEVLRSMLFHKLIVSTSAILIVIAVAAGAGLLAYAQPQPPPPERPEGPPAKAAGQPHREKSADAIGRPAPGRMLVVGRVLDPAGMPVAGAPVEVVGRPRRLLPGTDERPWEPPVLIAEGRTDGDGRFRLDGVRTTSAGFFNVFVLVAGSSFGWAELNTDADQPRAEIRLRPEQLIRGQLVAPDGKPATGVVLRTVAFGLAPNIRVHDEVQLSDGLPENSRAWPAPVRTDDQGRFELHGVGRGLYVALVVEDPRFAPQRIDIGTDDRAGAVDFRGSLQTAMLIKGLVLAGDTGRPIPRAMVQVAGVKRRADDAGRFRIPAPPGDQTWGGVHPPEGEPYPAMSFESDWFRGVGKDEVVVRIPRGVVLRGKVTEAGTDRPLAGASVMYATTRGPSNIRGKWDAMVLSKDDGSYEIVVPPGRGYLFGFGPGPDYLLDEIGQNQVFDGDPGGQRLYAHAIARYEVSAGDSPHTIALALRRGETIKGRVVGPDGGPIAHASILTRLRIEPFNWSWRGDESFQIPARDGRFVVHGLDPARSVPVYFLDARHELGAAVEFTGKQAGDDLTVTLRPTGRATARFLGPDGKPAAGLLPHIELVVTPGPIARRGELSADAARLIQIDPQHYWRPNRLVTDAEGRITFPDLIPGAPYRISDPRTKRGWQVRRDFTVKSGQTVELGDILLENPASR